MSQPDFDSIASRLRASHGLTSLGNGNIGGTMHGLVVRVRRGRGTVYAVDVSVDAGSQQAPRARRSLEHRVFGLPSEVAVEIGGKGPIIRARVTDPGSKLDSLAMVGAIEALVNAVSLAVNTEPAVTGRHHRRVPALNSAVSET